MLMYVKHYFYTIIFYLPDNFWDSSSKFFIFKGKYKTRNNIAYEMF